MTTRMRVGHIAILTALAVAALMSIGAVSASAITCTDGLSACAPSIDVTKGGPTYVAQGATATYTYSVRNTGGQNLTAVTLSDDRCTPLTNTTDPPDNDGVLEVGATWTYSCTYAPLGAIGDSVTNTATATAVYNPVQGPQVPVSSTDYHTTTIIGLQIAKTVDKPTADPYDTLNYTITITNAGPAWAYLEGRVFEDDYGCYGLQSNDPNSEGTYWSLAPGQSVTYTCSHLYDPQYDGNSYTNTACARADVYEQVARTPSSQSYYYQVEKCASATTTRAQHVVTGQVFEDMNADGARQDGEPALPGIVVYADLNGNGVRNEGEPSSTSDGQGHYSLEVALGKSTIREDVPGGFTCSFPAGCAYTVDLPANLPPERHTRPLHARAVDPSGLDFGDWRPASVSGTVVEDLNANGSRDAGELGKAGVLVFADLNANDILDLGEPATSTASDGSYAIGGLKPGGYVIRHVLGAGVRCTAPAGCNHNLSLTSNAAATGKDFLDVSPAAQVVLGARISPGKARLSARSGCVSGAFSAQVRGTKIARVVFQLDGRRIATVHSPKRLAVRINLNSVTVGTHRLVALVTFTAASHTSSKTLRSSFQRCAAQLRAPLFTG
jgi:hypothetical protein